MENVEKQVLSTENLINASHIKSSIFPFVCNF